MISSISSFFKDNNSISIPQISDDEVINILSFMNVNSKEINDFCLSSRRFKEIVDRCSPIHNLYQFLFAQEYPACLLKKKAFPPLTGKQLSNVFVENTKK